MRLILELTAAIVDLRHGTRWSAAELAAEAHRRAALLRRHGAAPRRHVVIAHGGTPAFFADLLAVWQTGACAVCLNPGLTAGEFETVIGFVAPVAVLADGAAGPALNIAAPILALADAPVADDAPAESGAGLDDPALVLFTSGTTGDPKGVVHSFRALLARTALNSARIGAAALARTLCVLPTHFGHGLIGNCLTPLVAGGTLFLYPEPGVKGAAALGSVLADHHISFMSSVPSLWRVALKAGRPPARATLRQVNIGSAPLSAGLWREVAAWTGTDHVVNAYGITETANWAAGASARDHAPEDGLIGRMWGGSAAVCDAAGNLHATGDGELLLQTPALMQGYLRRADLTAAVLRDGWFHTGDYGRIEDDGTMRLTGRLKHEINRAGIKIHPEEIDLLLERHPDIVEACTFGLPDPVSGELVAVALRLAEGAPGEVDGVRAWCRERIKRESVPERWFVLTEIAKTDRGKVDRRAVMDAGREQGRAR